MYCRVRSRAHGSGFHLGAAGERMERRPGHEAPGL